jgi:hypothetical protein
MDQEGVRPLNNPSQFEVSHGLQRTFKQALFISHKKIVKIKSRYAVFAELIIKNLSI